jgi:hypothetical protein
MPRSRPDDQWLKLADGGKMEIGHPTTNTLPTRMICTNHDSVAKRKKNSSVSSPVHRPPTVGKVPPQVTEGDARTGHVPLQPMGGMVLPPPDDFSQPAALGFVSHDIGFVFDFVKSHDHTRFCSDLKNLMDLRHEHVFPELASFGAFRRSAPD